MNHELYSTLFQGLEEVNFGRWIARYLFQV